MSERRYQRESGDYSHYRSADKDPLTKWAVKIGLGLMVLTLTGLVGWAFTGIDEKADQGVEANTRVGIVENEQEHIKEDLKDLKGGQKTIVKGITTTGRSMWPRPQS